jgi:hypothetical protein
MKRIFFLAPLLFMLGLILNSCNHPDSNIKSVKIGNQVWMSENLNVDHFRNGDLIPEAKTEND